MACFAGGVFVFVKQFGVLHAPFAPARALWYEGGMGTCRVAVQDEKGRLFLTSIDELVLDSPGWCG